MSIIRDIIERVDDIKPNAFTPKTKLAWMSELDGKIAADVMLMGIEDIRQMEYSYPDGLEEIPLVEYPHDSLYDEYLCAKIDYANGEYSKYQNSMEMFNAHYDNFIHWFIRTYAPAKGYSGCNVSQCGEKPPYYISAYALAVRHGFSGTIEEWLESLKGEMGDVTPEALEAVEKAEEFARIAEEAANSIVKGFDSGELPNDAYRYEFNVSEAQFVIVTIRCYQDDSHTVILDCLSLLDDTRSFEYYLPTGFGGRLFVVENDGIITISTEDSENDCHIHRVCGYRYGGSGGGDSEALSEHIANRSNPHNVTAEQIGAATKQEFEHLTRPLIVRQLEDGLASEAVQTMRYNTENGGNVYFALSSTNYIPLSFITYYDAYFTYVDEESGVIDTYRISSDRTVTMTEHMISGSTDPIIVAIDGQTGKANYTGIEIESLVWQGKTIFLKPTEAPQLISLNSAYEGNASFRWATDEDCSSVEYIIAEDGSVEIHNASYMEIWTAADKKQFIDEVIAALPVYSGEVQ